jgi:FKBP-type peptidyl-prolyl cis-trans isomerase (trigger factor)
MAKTAPTPTAKKTTAPTKKAAAHTHNHDQDHNHDHNHDQNHDHSLNQNHGSSLIADNTKITVTLPWKKVEEVYKKQLTKFAKNFKTNGFRKGKVPVSLVEKMIDQTKLIQATLEEVFPPAYGKAIEEGQYNPLTQPDVQPKNLEKGQDWVIEAQFAQAPQVKVDGYKKIIEAAKKEADKSWKEQEKAEVKDSKAEAKDSKAEAKDSKAEAKDSKADAQTNASKALTKKQLADAQREHLLHTIFKSLVSEFKPAIPELLLRTHTRQELQELEQHLKRVNATIDQFLQQRNQSFSDLTQELAAQTLGKLQLEFILRAIQEDLKVTVSDAQIKEEYEQLMSGYMKQSQAGNKAHKPAEKLKIPEMPESSREYIKRTLERRYLLEALTK